MTAFPDFSTLALDAGLPAVTLENVDRVRELVDPDLLDMDAAVVVCRLDVRQYEI